MGEVQSVRRAWGDSGGLQPGSQEVCGEQREGKKIILHLGFVSQAFKSERSKTLASSLLAVLLTCPALHTQAEWMEVPGA